MKNLVNNKIAEKICMGMLSLTFLFITLCSGNITYAAAPSKVNVLDGSSIDAGLTDISRDEERSFNGVFPNAAMEAGKASGKVSYKVEDGVGVLTLDNVNLATHHGLLDGGGVIDSTLRIKLVGDNKITTTPKAKTGNTEKASKSTFMTMGCNVEFVGSGNLTINQGLEEDDTTSDEKDTNGFAIRVVNNSLKFSTYGFIKINQRLDNAAVFVEQGSVVEGTYVDPILTLDKNSKLEVNHYNVGFYGEGDSSVGSAIASYGLYVKDKAELNVHQKIGGADAIASFGPIHVGPNAKVYVKIEEGAGSTRKSNAIKATGKTVVDGGTLIALDSDEDEANKDDGVGVTGSLELKKGSYFEAFGNYYALDPAKLVIDDDGEWEAFAGPTKETAQRLDATTGTGIMDAMKANNYPYLKVQPKVTNSNDPSNQTNPNNPSNQPNTNDPSANAGSANNAGASANKDGVPKTGDNTSVVPYVLLLAAGIFTVMVANKKIVLEK